MSPDSNPPDGSPINGGDSIPIEVVQDEADDHDGDSAAADSPTSAPATADSRLATLETQLAAAEKDKKDNFDKYLRAAADLENLRKRQRRELEDAKIDARGKALKEMLPVVDNLERAIEHAAAQMNEGDRSTKPLIEGVQLVLRQLITAFERLEVTPIDAMNQPFDPNQHEAISQLESDAAPGTVVQVLQRGYRSGDRLLRPALVVVAKAKASAE